MEDKRINELAKKWLDGIITNDEKQEFLSWYDVLEEELIIPGEFAASEAELQKRMLKNIKQKQEAKGKIFTGKFALVAAAASAIAAICFIALYSPVQKNVPLTTGTVNNEIKKPTDISPGGNKAILILGDGSSLVLDAVSNGTIATEKNIQIRKLKDGQIDYSLSGKQDVVTYNTLSTPRGGQYSITLSDGTKVWLNSSSSLRFPTAFTTSQRKVELTGEGYFEVAKNPARPFKVQVNEMEVQVLGTHFNIMAYQDEAMTKTTLLEGSVRINKNNTSTLLKHGQQIKIKQGENAGKVEEANIEEAIAWKNGMFYFNGATIEVIMRQLERWYDIDVVYERAVSEHFNGVISKNVGIAKVFEMLELTGAVHFRIQGKKILVRT
jgi:ferric-dicitrate binding protein FerR (iron transport regulator)